MVAILARYASRFSVRALDLTVDSSLLWVGALLAVVAAVLLAFVPRLPSADASQGFGLSSGSLRITGGTSRRLQRLRRDPDRRVLRAAGRRQHAAQDAARAASGADRLRHAAGARVERARHVVRTDARAERGLLQGSDAAHHRAAGRGSRRRGHRGSLARRAATSAPDSSSRRRARLARPARTIRARSFRTVSPGFFAALGVPLIAGRDFNDADRRGRRAGRHREPEPGPADVPEPGRGQPPPDVDRSRDEVHRGQHGPAAHRRGRRPTSTTRTWCRARR